MQTFEAQGGPHAMKDEAIYDSTWRSYRLNRVIFFILLIGWIPFGRGVSYFVETLHGPAILGNGFGFAWIAALLIQGSRLAVWPCPRCRKAFRGWLPYLPNRCSAIFHVGTVLGDADAVQIYASKWEARGVEMEFHTVSEDFRNAIHSGRT